jgi:hypothetical protein
MTTLAQATAAPIERTLGGEEYTLYPLNMRDFGRLQQWATDEVLRATRVSLTEEKERRKAMSAPALTEHETRVQWSEAYDFISRLHIFSRQGRGFLQSPEGMVRCLLMSVRRGAPDMTIADLEAIMPPPLELDWLHTELMHISGLLTPGEMEQARVQRAIATGDMQKEEVPGPPEVDPTATPETSPTMPSSADSSQT